MGEIPNVNREDAKIMRQFFCAISRSRRANASMPAMLAYAIAANVMLLALVGCGKHHGERGELYPAEGQVFLNQQPLAGAIVVLYPQGLADAKAVPSRAQTGPDGRFRVGTFAAADGAPEGEYAVTVVQYPLQQDGSGWTAGPNALPAKYASLKTTDLRVQIGDGENTLPALVLAGPNRPRGNAQVSSFYQYQSQ